MADPMPLTLAGAAGLATALALAPSAQAGVFRFHDEHVLGTRLNLVLVAEDEAHALRAARAARAEIARLDGALNARKPDSELFALNESSRFHASPDLFAVVERAEYWRALTGGAYDGRLGEPLRLWRDGEPDARALQAAVRAAGAPIGLDRRHRLIERPEGVTFALDGLAKGYIVDRALEAGLAAAPTVRGMLVDIGGDMRCWGQGPHGGLWEVGVSDPACGADNAECAALARLSNQAVAGSGRGPRDFTAGGKRLASTLSPKTGRPVEGQAGAAVIAGCAADADALATAFMVMEPQESLRLADQQGLPARIQSEGGQVHRSALWNSAAIEPAPRLIRTASPGAPVPKLPPELRWPGDWAVQFTYISPQRDESRRAADFRTPYMALWITDANNKPIRTIVMVGTESDWHKDNLVWWAQYRPQNDRMVQLRAERTALSGRYSLYWRGIDDNWNAVPVGEYVLHLETSQERGKRTYRTMKLKIGKEGFKTMMLPTPEGGGLEIVYGLSR